MLNSQKNLCSSLKSVRLLPSKIRFSQITRIFTDAGLSKNLCSFVKSVRLLPSKIRFSQITRIFTDAGLSKESVLICEICEIASFED